MNRIQFLRSAAALAVLVPASVQAAAYDFTITTSRDTSRGQFTVMGGTSPFTVTGVSGEVDGSAITGLSGYGGADERLSDTSPFVDRAGVAFSAGGVAYNIFDNYTDTAGHPVYSFCSSTFDGSCTGGSANAAPVASLSISAAGTVPEPASWALMLAGFGVVGGVMRRRATTVRVAA
jgi:hypothetical protein